MVPRGQPAPQSAAHTPPYFRLSATAPPAAITHLLLPVCCYCCCYCLPQVVVVHSQLFVIITRLNIDYPPPITRLQTLLSSITGAETYLSYSHACWGEGGGMLLGCGHLRG